ncbi:glucan endo-1,3-beta-glucosidase 8-like [Malania oleifera]|uniref:glucan endo-1,3-beta-glucosidase 8-like n=1 Tax=Malania oleifera TaxID=397392 RepID=UPI0025AE3F67|nr:glucan endo-1,3-beta-glucosidase 8-like [Malania oleifera]
MARAGVLRWAAVLISLLVVLVSSGGCVDAVGVNWGTMASHPLSPDVVVGMLKDNGFSKVKLFDADSWYVSALAGTGIEVMLAIPNNMLDKMSSSYGNAQDWVKENVTKHFGHGAPVNIKYVAVGNEPFLTSYNGTFQKSTFPALQNIQRALNEAGLGNTIKATVPLNADVYDSASDKPSDGIFRRDIKPLMTQIVQFLHANNAPFVVNIYPFLSLYSNPNFPVDFAFFDGGAKPISDKNNVQYTNVFDANYDTLVWALKKAGVPDLKILVGEIGWPTDGDKNANVKLAKRFYDGFFQKMAKNQGTPLRPGHLEVFLFGLIDEDMKSIAPGDFERHWGIFRYDGQPKFPMDFSGKGNDTMPVGAKGVQYQPLQWCVLNKNVKNMSLVGSNINYACANSDCTSLGYGSSCNHLDVRGNISYGFNMYYQMQDQDVEACDFDGLATVVTVNASQDGCLFPVQIVSAGERVRLVLSAVVGALFTFFALV